MEDLSELLFPPRTETKEEEVNKNNNIKSLLSSLLSSKLEDQALEFKVRELAVELLRRSPLASRAMAAAAGLAFSFILWIMWMVLPVVLLLISVLYFVGVINVRGLICLVILTLLLLLMAAVGMSTVMVNKAQRLLAAVASGVSEGILSLLPPLKRTLETGWGKIIPRN